MSPTPERTSLRAPESTDGARVNKLIEQCSPLDTNSVYCNLLQCTHFANTSVCAERGDELAGFVSAYLKPDQPDTLFVWQVAVGEAARGEGLASRMLVHILKRTESQGVHWLETSITESNKASWALFQGLASKIGAELESSVLFDQSTHFNNQHDSELLVRIGPFDSAGL